MRPYVVFLVRGLLLKILVSRALFAITAYCYRCFRCIPLSVHTALGRARISGNLSGQLASEWEGSAGELVGNKSAEEASEHVG